MCVKCHDAYKATEFTISTGESSEKYHLHWLTTHAQSMQN
jgi:hypothetical protein